MFIKVTIEGKPYEFEDSSADNVELMAIERATGMTVAEWADALGRGSMLATTALIWIIRHRVEPNLEFNDVHFHPSSLEIEAIGDDAPGKDAITS